MGEAKGYLFWKQKLLQTGICFTVYVKEYRDEHKYSKKKCVCGGVGNSYLWHPKLLQGDELNVKVRLLGRGWEPYLACLPYLTSSHGLISSFLIEKTLCSKKVCLSHFEITILWFPFRHMLRGDRGPC